jgi:hypothetical protein
MNDIISQLVLFFATFSIDFEQIIKKDAENSASIS